LSPSANSITKKLLPPPSTPSLLIYPPSDRYRVIF
ncbi:hypothetical protein L3X38_045500, partial [Prunus dulcis]